MTKMNDFQNRFKSKRIPWTHDELVLCLAYYLFIYQYDAKIQSYQKFADNLRMMTKNNRSDVI